MRNNMAVGNDFIVPQTGFINKIQVVSEVSQSVSVQIPIHLNPTRESKSSKSLYIKTLDILHNHSLIVFALLILAIAFTGAPIATAYFTRDLTLSLKAAPLSALATSNNITGINTSLSSSQFHGWLNNLTSQAATLNLGNQNVAIAPDIIKSWLQITSNSSKTEYNVHVKEDAVSSSLMSLANKYVESPVSQVVATRTDGSSEIAVNGKNGTKLLDPSSISSQAASVSKNLFSNKGFQINAPLVVLPFQSVTPSAFSKLILVDVNSKKMYAYQNGQIVNTFLVSAGAPATPTPIGEYHIYEKLAVQDMSGYNSNGTKYFQPHVHFINYFYGGDAVHGVYWHPLSWFGANNSSHGCVGLPDDIAQWVYNWAPIGTTVITTAT